MIANVIQPVQGGWSSPEGSQRKTAAAGKSSSSGSWAGRRGWVRQVVGHYLSVPSEHWWPWLVGSDSNSREQMRESEGRRMKSVSQHKQTRCSVCTSRVITMVVLTHMLDCSSIFACVCRQSHTHTHPHTHTHLTSAGSNALTATANVYSKFSSWVTRSINCTECPVSPLHWG